MARAILRHFCLLGMLFSMIPPRDAVGQESRSWDPDHYVLTIPRIEKRPVIDGDLADWKALAHCDGLWDISRLRNSPWYNPEINRLTDHGNEPEPVEDLQARYYLAWDEEFLYFGAEVRDNVNDVKDRQHAPERWYFKDAIALFVEAPADANRESFGEGDNAFCFVADRSMPAYGAWWRHGSATARYLEEPPSKSAVDYALRMDPWKRGQGDFALEARISMKSTLGRSDPMWHAPRKGDTYRVQIVHTDPDGGDYGGHFLLYGQGDDDGTWAKMILGDSIRPIRRGVE